MKSRLAAITLLGAGLLLAPGCLSHVPRLPGLESSAYERIGWRSDLAAARQEALERGRPLLVVAVAGERDGHC